MILGLWKWHRRDLEDETCNRWMSEIKLKRFIQFLLLCCLDMLKFILVSFIVKHSIWCGKNWWDFIGKRIAQILQLPGETNIFALLTVCTFSPSQDLMTDNNGYHVNSLVNFRGYNTNSWHKKMVEWQNGSKKRKKEESNWKCVQLEWMVKIYSRLLLLD